MLTSGDVVVRHRVPGFSERWVIVEEKVPEAPIHDACVELFRLLLVAWIARSARTAHAYRNVAIRVRADRPQLGFDPDVCLVEPAPESAAEIDSLRLWLRNRRTTGTDPHGARRWALGWCRPTPASGYGSPTMSKAAGSGSPARKPRANANRPH
jgi:hypothetical protein